MIDSSVKEKSFNNILKMSRHTFVRNMNEDDFDDDADDFASSYGSSVGKKRQEKYSSFSFI